MKTSIDTEQLKANINLIELAGRYTELRRASPKEWHGPCPWCGGDDRFRVTVDHFACRPDGGHCGRKGDAIEFVMQRQNVDFRTAVSMLGGDVPMNTGEKVKPVSKPAESAHTWDEPKYRREAVASHVNLVAVATRHASTCMEYLQDRGIEPETIKAFGIGYTAVYLPNAFDFESKTESYPKQLAISLPWFNHDGALVAVKYRFIEPHTYTDKDGKQQKGKDGEGVRFTSRGQVPGNCFGWQALRGADRCDVLIICEGEINALSLWQAGRGAVDVLSTGSEATTKKLPPVVVDLAQDYKHLIVWADEKEIADAAASQIGGAAMRSYAATDANGNPIYRSDGKPKKLDANDFLKAGKLGALLAAMLGRLGVSIPTESPVSQAVADPAPLPPLRSRAGKPALPADQWIDGIATLGEALRIQKTLAAQHATALGKDNERGRYYVRGNGWQWTT